jgi:hypothetical protein
VTQDDVVGRVVDALVELGVPYMVAGSFASNLHGVPRMTQDADIVIDVDEPLVLRLVGLLQKDFYASEDAAREAVRLRRMFNAIHFDTGFKVDLVVKKLRPFSAEELRRRERGRLAGRAVDFATAEDTILTKLEWARLGDSERQYGDAVGIIQIQRDALDWPYLERWATELGLSDLLSRARRGEGFQLG